MKNILLTTIVVALGFLCPLNAQYLTVKYDAVNNWFNQGQALPAEVDLVFTGPVSSDILRIEVSFLDTKHHEILYTGNWRRTAKETEFSLPINYKLRSDFNYDVELAYFKKMTDAEIKQLRQQLQVNLETLLDVNQKQSTSIEFKGNRRKLVEAMNDLLAEQLSSYRALVDNWSPMLSELVDLKLRQMEQADLSHNFQRQDTTQVKKAVKNAVRSEYTLAFKQLLADEINTILDRDLYRLHDSRIVEDYRTEKKPTVLSLSLGYGGLYLSGKGSNSQYDSSPYAGIAIPLGNRVLGTKFFRNAAINTGVFFSTFQNDKGQEVNGFLVKQPIYLGLDYKMFQFIHLNVGTAFLNGNTLEEYETVSSSNQKLAFRPFVGLSARINLRLGLGN